MRQLLAIQFFNIDYMLTKTITQNQYRIENNM